MPATSPGTRVRVKLDGFNHGGVKIAGRLSSTGTIETVNKLSHTVAVKLDISVAGAAIVVVPSDHVLAL